MDNEKYIKRCYELAIKAGKKGFDTFGPYSFITEKSLKRQKTPPFGTRDCLVMRNSIWFTNAQTDIPIQF